MASRGKVLEGAAAHPSAAYPEALAAMERRLQRSFEAQLAIQTEALREEHTQLRNQISNLQVEIRDAISNVREDTRALKRTVTEQRHTIDEHGRMIASLMTDRGSCARSRAMAGQLPAAVRPEAC